MLGYSENFYKVQLEINRVNDIKRMQKLNKNIEDSKIELSKFKESFFKKGEDCVEMVEIKRKEIK